MRRAAARMICRLLQRDEAQVADLEAMHAAAQQDGEDEACSMLRVVFSCMEQWQQDAEDIIQHTAAGVVYLATSPSLSAVKIGYWTGSLARLLQRYKTYYGAATEVVSKHVQDARLSEKVMHHKFRHRKQSHELFDKQYSDGYDVAINHL